MKIHIMQHTDNEGPGMIAEWAEAHDCELILHRPDRGDDIQTLNPAEMDGLIVLGGPQNVDDESSWLAAERILIRSLDKLGRPVFGVCLGAQQIVRAFGAAVVPMNRGEFGRSQVQGVADGQPLTVFQWHEQAMTQLPGSDLLYRSAGIANQGFHYHSRILGLQFHLEFDLAAQQALIDAGDLPAVQPLTQAETAAAQERLTQHLTKTFL